MFCCAAESSRYFVLTDHPGMLHKYCLIKCVCARARKAILPVNLRAGRNWSYLSAARCFPAHFLWMKKGFFVVVVVFCFSFFLHRALDENSEPELLCQEDTESKREGVGEK